MFCEMDPPIGRSIYKVGDHAWKIGTSIVCEKVSKIPEDALAHWQDQNMDTFCLRPAESMQVETEEMTPVYNSGTSGAVWNIGGAFFKVKSWQEGTELENETIDFVEERLEGIPLPKVLYAWNEPELSRSYLVLHQMPGTLLERVWSSLSAAQHKEIATEIAGYCEMLATITSDSLKTATGCGIADAHHDTIFVEKYLSSSNILILDGKASGILDWEHAAFYPRFWIATKPHLSCGFILKGEDAWAWTRLLSQALMESGFKDDLSGFQRWRESSRNTELT
ncbi:hypothetical protein EJ05DRAFT_497386 [Pseudovirgaria hyperparasitica]|uniref:Aminoglycoside phosphotransferase domain-containing protein n=1 Tax=Pseudovirgaria hyperparasitica TaxID=470096 RepID=A0A6A6WF83_9PEZI|nr:uncharacterized protein EJ05DRAFT_497386 [Pseudovirgaria hyperparasitica]KAF2760819.1 hypothetical protein EJ05DRAFT_497386 [Pseudovirgaria hyperparasitica]